jgi:hypothetical protein
LQFKKNIKKTKKNLTLHIHFVARKYTKKYQKKKNNSCASYSYSNKKKHKKTIKCFLFFHLLLLLQQENTKMTKIKPKNQFLTTTRKHTNKHKQNKFLKKVPKRPKKRQKIV